MQTKPLDRTDGPRDRAIHYAPEVAFDRPVPPVVPRAFREERDRAFAAGAPTGFVDLDQGREIGCDWPATTPTLLARYLVLRAGEPFAATLPSTGDTYYVIRGAGRTECGGEALAWQAGDAMCLPGGEEARHVASDDAVLLVVNNEPELRYLMARPDPAAARIQPTLFKAGLTDEGLRGVHGRNGEQRAAGKSVIFVTQEMAERRLTTRTMLAAVNTLEPGGDQRPHRHASAALTLCIQGEGVFSKVGDETIEWAPDVLMVTPPGLPHSHHNRGSQMMRSFVVQDTALHTQLRTTNFAWTD